MARVAIIGGGASGLTASIYAKRAGKNVLLIDKSAPGGLLNKIDSITMKGLERIIYISFVGYNDLDYTENMASSTAIRNIIKNNAFDDY